MIKTLIFISLALITTFNGIIYANEMIPGMPLKYSPPGPNDVHISPVGIAIPREKILLVRKGSEYCAIKFTKLWTGKDKRDYHVKYESYQQGDGTGNFSNSNVAFVEKEASSHIRGFFRFRFQTGTSYVQCGNINLCWVPQAFVYFFPWGQHGCLPEEDYGIELAPTPWTSINEVNIFDQRVRWYIYDGKRKHVNIQIDKLWER